MRIGKQYLGKVCEVQWMDPCFQRCDVGDSPKGRAALATWREYGIVVDVTDGIVKIVHSAASHVGKSVEEADEHAFTPVPESLIEKIVVFSPAPDQPPI